ncbi:hypothetical protein [Erythrobacter sp. CCH5-A1]|jgi:hypothetical protein|uniref:hypothetical protein n=1 Tax=Erythrobacter sp. CCH5-A1 TaxID=1768792 RepID=UPI000B27C2B7|nr:hypothetical protein [Erythrobacter sp. CCH5-A1]
MSFSIAVMNYFQSHLRLKVARPFLYRARPERSLSPLIVRATPTTTEQGTRTMTMISEKAVALLLAVALSGTAFNTFIV